MYSPYQRIWLQILNRNLAYYLEDCPPPYPNPKSIRKDGAFIALFETPIPESIVGFELGLKEQEKMNEVWPAGEDIAAKVCDVHGHQTDLMI